MKRAVAVLICCTVLIGLAVPVANAEPRPQDIRLGGARPALLREHAARFRLRPNGARAAAPTKPILPTILSVVTSKDVLSASGGTIHVTARVSGATTCQLALTSHPWVRVRLRTAESSCVHGAFAATVTVGVNVVVLREPIVFKFSAHGATATSTRKFMVRVDKAPPTVAAPPTAPSAAAAPTATLSISTAMLSSAGGEIDLTYSSANASSCTISSTPAFWPGSDPTGVGCSGTYQSSVPATTTGAQWTFTFAATSPSGEFAAVSQTLVEMPPPPTVTSISVVMMLSSNVTNSISDSTTVDYSEVLSATCTYSNATTAPCSIPSGVVSYEIDGADAPVGNFTYLSSSTDCIQDVGSSISGSGCDITWSTYGDQWVTATFVSSSAPSVSQTLEVDVQAPVDLAVGLTYSNYQNAGTGAINDCTMASVADWIETTLRTTPSEAETVGAYWSAEDEFNGGDDEGLSVNQLFSYWQNTGIDGTFLTGTQAVTTQSAAESEVADGYVLINIEELPAGFPPASDAEGGGHAWIMVGYSGYGPMVVTWGEEVQISWAEFNSWTQDVYAVGVSA
jgi:hypothetical protein